MKLSIYLLYICWSIVSLLGCTQDKTHTQLGAKDFEQQAKNTQGVLLDVRTPEEYTESHLANAMNIDYKADTFRTAIARLDKSKAYFVYCKAGVRSEKAIDIMYEMGFTQVYHMDGGIDAWKKEGLPLQK